MKNPNQPRGTRISSSRWAWVTAAATRDLSKDTIDRQINGR